MCAGFQSIPPAIRRVLSKLPLAGCITDVIHNPGYIDVYVDHGSMSRQEHEALVSIDEFICTGVVLDVNGVLFEGYRIRFKDGGLYLVT